MKARLLVLPYSKNGSQGVQRISNHRGQVIGELQQRLREDYMALRTTRFNPYPDIRIGFETAKNWKLLATPQ